jgi:hypothetical protein
MGKPKKNKETAELDKIIEEITTDASGDDECYGAFMAVLEDELGKDINARVMGEDVRHCRCVGREEREAQMRGSFASAPHARRPLGDRAI